MNGAEPRPRLLRGGVLSWIRVDPARGVCDSRQWVDVPVEREPVERARLLERLDREYGRAIVRLTAGLVAVRWDAGDRLRAEVPPLGWPEILVLGPRRPEGSDRSARAIEGGWLVARSGGALALEASAIEGGTRLAVDLRSFSARALAWTGEGCYAGTQAALHERHARFVLLRVGVPLVSTAR